MFRQGLRRAKRALKPLDNDVTILQINIVQAQVADLRCPQAVLVGDDDHRPFPCALLLSRLEHSKHLRWFEMNHCLAVCLSSFCHSVIRKMQQYVQLCSSRLLRKLFVCELRFLRNATEWVVCCVSISPPSRLARLPRRAVPDGGRLSGRRSS